MEELTVMLIQQNYMHRMICSFRIFFSFALCDGEGNGRGAKWKYLRDYLNGNKVNNLEEKLQMTDKNIIDGLV